LEPAPQAVLQTLKTFRSLTSELVVDTRNATKDLHEFKDKIIKVGDGEYAVLSPEAV
jgi:hypothetical protein